jgi:hypothetical protein
LNWLLSLPEYIVGGPVVSFETVGVLPKVLAIVGALCEIDRRR